MSPAQRRFGRSSLGPWGAGPVRGDRMTSRRAVLLAVVCTGAVALAAPMAAQAKTKSVSMGPSPTAAKAFNPLGADVNDFFPDRVTIHVGDSVRFLPANFHTVNIPARRGAKGPLPFITPTGQKVAGALDAGGQPFWFNGQPALAVNPAVGGAAGLGKRFVYTGKKRIESGVPGPSGPPKSMTVKFTTKGTLTYYCDVHPGMKASIVVRPRKRPLPTARQDAK